MVRLRRALAGPARILRTCGLEPELPVTSGSEGRGSHFLSPPTSPFCPAPPSFSLSALCLMACGSGRGTRVPPRLGSTETLQSWQKRMLCFPSELPFRAKQTLCCQPVRRRCSHGGGRERDSVSARDAHTMAGRKGDSVSAGDSLGSRAFYLSCPNQIGTSHRHSSSALAALCSTPLSTTSTLPQIDPLIPNSTVPVINGVGHQGGSSQLAHCGPN